MRYWYHIGNTSNSITNALTSSFCNIICHTLIVVEGGPGIVTNKTVGILGVADLGDLYEPQHWFQGVQVKSIKNHTLKIRT